MPKPLVVTIDGPAGVGKTTLARRTAQALGVAYLDTGAMFRTTALELGSGADALAADELDARLAALEFTLSGEGEASTLFVNGRRIGEEIRTEEVGMMASRVAVLPQVRAFQKVAQQRLGRATSLVVEGRDMGTVVFPDATCKIFLDATPEVRAERRFKQLQEMGKPADLDALARQIRERDDMDRNRAEAPLRPADDAVIIDTSHMTIDEVFAAITATVETVRAHGASAAPERIDAAPAQDGPDVWFVGAGPGDPELITVKGQRLVREADVVIYAGSLVPRAIVAEAREDAEVYDSAPMNLDETHALIREAVAAGKSVVRVHTGDPALYGAVREQARLLDADGITWQVVPGVTASFAGAAAAGLSFTVPEKTQTLIITRMEGRTPVPEGERLRELAQHGTSLAVYLSAGDPEGLQSELEAAGLAGDVRVVVAYRVGWPEETLAYTTLSELAVTARENGFTRQTVFLILPGEDDEDHVSKLYDKNFTHGYRA